MSQAATKTTVTATGAAKAGTAKAPASFTGSFVYNAFEENPALRAANPITFEWWWDGVQIGGNGFPTCTAAQIDAAQSDAGCPKGSLIGQVTALVAELGPEADRSQKITCLGKDVRFYNSGPSSIVWFVVGPGEQCAGVTYLPPFETQLKKVGNSTHVVTTLPDNIRSPLPGVQGGLPKLPTAYFKSSIKVKGKKGQKAKTQYYVRSVGCKGTRLFHFTTVDVEGTQTVTAPAGKCAKPKKKKKK